MIYPPAEPNVRPPDTAVAHEIQTTEAVNKLIEGNLDSADGFELAAARTSSEPVEELCRNVASVRRRHAVELQRGISARGATPPNTGSWLSRLHLWWVDLLQKFRRRSTPTLLQACERSERQLRDDYEHVVGLTKVLPLRTTILRQQAHVTETCHVLGNMRHAAEQA